jgi:hypothetical protein
MRAGATASTLRIAIVAFLLFRAALAGFLSALAYLANLLLFAQLLETEEIIQYYTFIL